MYNGFLKVGAVTPQVKVCDVKFNCERIKEAIANAESRGVEVLVLPELCITSSTCGDLFFSDVLLNGAMNGLKDVAEFTKGKSILVFVSLPIKKDGKLNIVSAPILDGTVLCFIPKNILSDSQARWFSPFYGQSSVYIGQGEENAILSENIILSNPNGNVKICVDFLDGIISPYSPSVRHATVGANLMVCHASTPALIEQAEFKTQMLKAESYKTLSAYALSDTGSGESTTDQVYGSGNCVVECGEILSSAKVFDNELTIADVDTCFIESERIRNKITDSENSDYIYVGIDFKSKPFNLDRNYTDTPFVPSMGLKERADLILDIQSEGLKKRVSHTNAKGLVLGLSGGLDSTLAILVAVRAMEKLGRSKKDVVAVTMPCFGTTSRTYLNTIKLAKALGVTLKKVDITKSVLKHLKDIKHDTSVTDATYENAQARERTQVLMDIANSVSGLVVGTGDLSELALGWATYNGDHMSMYGVNASIPKTLVRFVVENYKNNSKGKLKAVLDDILDTPVSPELLPPKDGDIAQKTEDIVGPYVLHDFYLYHLIRRGSEPKKVYLIAKKTFKGQFSEQEILKWLKTFVRRFFSQQFKRSCVPDGVRVGTVALSPREGLKMPSDAIASLWLEQLENL